MHTVHVCKYKHSSFFAQDGNTPLLLAAAGGHVEVVRMLLNEFNSSLDEVNNVSVYAPACSKYYVHGDTCISVKLCCCLLQWSLWLTVCAG